MSRASPESLAKAALITALRRARKVHADVVISELVIDKWTNRADLVTVGSELVGYEIKTRTDKLTRLEAQITSYSCVFDRVFVVAASRHINAIMTVIPDHVGIKEILDFGEGLEIRDVKPAALSPSVEARSSLQLLPALEIKRLLADLEIRAEGRVRSALVEEAEALSLASIRQFLRSYLRRRYGPTSSTFMTEIKGRRITPEDLQLLRLWGEVKEMSHCIFSSVKGEDWSNSTVQEGGLGSVPADIRLRFA